MTNSKPKQFLAAALVVFSTQAMAAIPFLCGNTGNLVNGTGSGSVTCFLDAGPGNILTTITLDRSADAKTVLTGAPVVSFDWLAPSGIAATAGAITFILTVPETGGAFTASPPSPFSVTFAGPGTQTASFFDSFSSSVTGGTLMSSFGTLGGSFSASAVPEPSTGALLSAGLLGLALLGGGCAAVPAHHAPSTCQRPGAVQRREPGGSEVENSLARWHRAPWDAAAGVHAAAG